MSTQRSMRRAAAALLLCGLLPLLPDAAHGEWPRHFDTSVSISDPAIAVDPLNGDVFMAGIFSGTVVFNSETGTQRTARGATDVYVVKYDRLGAFQWVQTADSSGPLTLGGLALDDTGDVFVAGFFDRAGATFGEHSVELVGSFIRDDHRNLFFAKLRDGGDTAEWSFAGSAAPLPVVFEPGSNVTYPFEGDVNVVTGLAISGQNAYISASIHRFARTGGVSQPPFAVLQGAIWRFPVGLGSDPPGTDSGQIFYELLPEPGSTPILEISAIGAGNDRVFFAGRLDTVGDGIIAFTASLNLAGGTRIWAEKEDYSYTSMAVDSNGDPHFAGGSEIQKRNGSTGESIWTLKNGDTAGVQAVTLDDGDNVYLASLRIGGTYVCKYRRGDTSNPVWSSHTEGNGYPWPRSIAVRGDDVYVAGYFIATGTVEFGNVSVSGAPDTHFVANLEAVGGNWFGLDIWTAGQEISPPQGVPNPPVRPIPEIPNVSDPESYFYWNATTRKYYAVRAVAAAVVRWPSGTGLDAPTIRTNGRVLWPGPGPGAHQLHVPGAAVYLQPESLTTATFEELAFSESPDATVDADNVFRSSGPGFSVLRYEVLGGGTHFEVAKTGPPVFTMAVFCTVGVPIDPDIYHDDPGGGTGHVVLPASIDATGPDRAYDVATRHGSILPVNASTDITVWWYRPSALGVGWPNYPHRYRCNWPEGADRIVIDELVGSEYGGQPLLDPDVFPEARLYVQNDPSLPGFNPNEEHALLEESNPAPPGGCPDAADPPCPRSGFQAVFALRQQQDTTASEPYVLLKYRDGGEWRMKVYQVLNSVDGNAFAFDVTVPQLVPLPYPLGQVGSCTDTFGTGVPYWEDVHGSVYARSAGAMFVTYFYPLRPDFYDDPESTGGNTGHPGDCVQWLAELPDPLDPALSLRVRYQAVWPESPPVLRVGETLIGPRNGLPDIYGQSSVEVIFQGDESDSSQPFPDPETGAEDPIHLVKLFDPLARRWVDVDDSDSDLFRQVIEEAPFYLKERLEYDPVLSRLGFKGLLGDSSAGDDPLLLINVMSDRERNALMNLRACDAVCESAVGELYDLSRDPDGLSPIEGELTIGLPRRLARRGGVLSAGAARGTGYVTVAFNDDLELSLPISLEVIRVDCGPYRGTIHVLPSENVFDERLTLRHSGDFAGEPDRFSFDWYRKMAPYDPVPTDQPPGGDWQGFQLAAGVDVNILPGSAAEVVIPDNYYFVRYRDAGDSPGCPGYSAFAGDPTGFAKLAEGWIKRVIRGLNPFQARTTDFHAAPANTYASLLIQAGEPYAGPVALNDDPDNLNRIGLIEAYETVLRRGKDLTLRASTPFYSEAVGTALLLAAGRIADLHLLLGNEAASDAADPTIGFGTASGVYGTLAPSIFAFQNQLPSLLDEELALLRGRDDPGVDPFFNRLIWNFTSGEGELAYALVYDVSDQNGDGRINEADARVQFPQAHGDAWGHYLTAAKSYYRLLREPLYVWTPRAEQVNVAGVAVTVDYRDERKLARAAAERARTGSEIVSLTYREEYVEDPAGQWQGYKDTDAARAWGVDGWARRAGQGAYFDWVVANALLPDVSEGMGAKPCALADDEDFPEFPDGECPNVEAAAQIELIDRTTVPEIGEIACHFEEIQTRLDEADLGLNPLGLAKGVVPFDVDPAEVDAGKTHFEQIAGRAEKALANAVAVFDHANRVTESLRRNQDTLADFRQNVGERERDFMNRLIEIFGLPYTDDVGGGGTYPSGYEGPDVYHYQYVEPTPLTGTASAPAEVVEAFFSPIPGLGFFPGEEGPVDPDAEITVRYEVGSRRAGLVRPASWTGERRAPGEIQRVLSSYYQGLASYDQALQEYDNLLEEIVDAREILDTIRAASASELEILNDQLGTVRSLDAAILTAQAAQLVLRRTSETISALADATVEAFPKVVGLSSDATSTARATVLFAARASVIPLEQVADVAEGAQLGFELAKEETELTTAIRIADEVPDVEEERQLRRLEQLLRQEPVLRLEALNRREALAQTLGTYRAALSRGLRLLDELASFRAQTAANVQEYRYQDVAFRLTRNDALQKYRAQFDLAARYVYLAATAYDYETNLLGSADGAGRDFLTDVVRHRSLGQVLDGVPVAGSRGLADPLARLLQNFQVLAGQLGFNNPQTETTPFSLRRELLRLRDASDEAWREELMKYRVENLWDLPEFRRYARPFAPEPPPGVREPGLVIGFEGNGGAPLRTTVTTGQNFFGWPLGAGDSSYDTTHFATRIRSVGVWFGKLDSSGVSTTPRVYLIPVGADVLRPPTAGDFSTREWQVVDQVLPTPFPIGSADLSNPGWIPLNDSLSGELGGVRRFSRFRAYSDSGSFNPGETTTDSRLIGRSVWNTRWLLIIPGETLLADKERGLDLFIDHVDDVKLFFQTYAYSGN